MKSLGSIFTAESLPVEMQLEPRPQICNCDSGKDITQKKSISPKAPNSYTNRCLVTVSIPRFYYKGQDGAASQLPGQVWRQQPYHSFPGSATYTEGTTPWLSRFSVLVLVRSHKVVRAARAPESGKRNLLLELWLRPTGEHLKKEEGKKILNNYGLYLCNVFINKGAEVSS